MKTIRPLLFVLIFLLCIPLLSLAQVSQNLLEKSQPQYEIGAGFITLNIPDYPGSNNTRVRVVPFPWFIYRGKYLRADDEGTRARVLSSKRHEMGVSLGFNFPVNSEDNQSRQGMPNLDALISFGPRLLFRLLTDSQNHKLNFTLAGRAVFSTKLSFNNLMRAEGFAYEPKINYWHRWKQSKTTFFSSAGMEFGSAKYSSFFYNVSPTFQTPERNSFSAKAGLIESFFSMGFGQQLGDELFIFASGSIRNFDWAANKESPLVESRNNVGMLVGVVWTFFESDEKVKRL